MWPLPCTLLGPRRTHTSTRPRGRFSATLRWHLMEYFDSLTTLTVVRKKNSALSCPSLPRGSQIETSPPPPRPFRCGPRTDGRHVSAAPSAPRAVPLLDGVAGPPPLITLTTTIPHCQHIGHSFIETTTKRRAWRPGSGGVLGKTPVNGAGY